MLPGVTVSPIRKQPVVSVGELGVSTAATVGRTLYDDFHPALRGAKAHRVYSEMAWNDATIGAVLYAVEQLVRGVEWTIESDDPDTETFLTANLAGMTHSWDEYVAQAVSMIIYGWAAFEKVYRVEDGRVLWEKIAFRDQSTLAEWKLDAHGDLVALVQATRSGQHVEIPADKLIHFRTATVAGRPEGVSWLRRAYRAWHLKKRVEEWVTIGVQRDLNGIPIARVPAEVALAGAGDPTYDLIAKVVTGVKVDEMQGIIWPGDRDEQGNPYYDIELLSTQGRAKVDGLALIRSLAGDISSVMLAQFIGLGRDAIGSRALAEPQQEIFQTALTALLDVIEETHHRQATRQLLEINGLPAGRIVHGELRDLDLEALGNFILRTSQAGADYFPPGEGRTTDELRQIAGLDPVESVIVADSNVNDRAAAAPLEE
jgi:hypothetical protein